MSSDAAISAHNVSKVFDLGLTGRSESLLRVVERRLRHPLRRKPAREPFRALDDVSFDVGRGEAVGVIGRNGAGKSTLLKILSRITPPSSGYIDLVGTVGSLLEVGTGFHPELTGIENVYMNGTILGMKTSEIDRRLDEIVAFSEVDKFLDTPVKRYSSGMRVRLAFAVAVHLDPEILIIDEVLSVGDAGFQAKCIAKMKSVASEDGRTVLYVTHNLVTLEHFCPRSILLIDGKLTEDGPTAETVATYLRTYPRGVPGDAAGVYDLAAADRSDGRYQPVFKRLVMRPDGEAPSDLVRMGGQLQLEIDVEGIEDVAPKVLVTFFSAGGVVLFRATSTMRPLVAAQARASHETIVLTIPSVPLVPAEYSIELHMGTAEGTLDYVGDAGRLKVMAADTLGTGYLFGPNDGHFSVDWDWELRPTARLTAPPAADPVADSDAVPDPAHLA